MRNKVSFLLVALALSTSLAVAQSVTSASINGRVEGKSADRTVVLPGTTVTAVHTPTGTVFEAVTRDNGDFNIPAMKVGGPYAVTVVMEGFKKEEIKDIYLKLGETRTINLTLVMDVVNAGEVVVTGTNEIINSSRTGASQNVDLQTIENMPTIGRSLDDFTRLSPQFDSNRERAGSFSAGGRSPRYNNIQIDGAQNNDLFGLSDSLTPGGSAGTTPISLDAVQEFQMVMAPFDVRQGSFTGGAVNVITRSGTNEFHGSGYYYGRNQDMVGKGFDNTKYPTFNQKTIGVRIGGPILKDRIFFFASVEFVRQNSPTDYLIDGSGSAYDIGFLPVAERFVNILKTKYNYDPGAYDQFINRKTDSDKYLVRFDWNINKNNRLTVRNNYIKASNDSIYEYNNSFRFPDNAYTYKNTTNSTVVQLFTTLGNTTYNELILGYTRLRDIRAYGDAFPQVTVYAGAVTLRAGTEQYSGANALDQDIIEVTDNFNWIKGNHAFVFGTHNEFFKFRNVFIRDFYGTYTFQSMDLFDQGKASNYYLNFSNTGDPLQPAKFKVSQFGFYAGDTWSVSPNFKVTYGVRMDVPVIPDKPSYNPIVDGAFGIRTDETPSGIMQWSPRVGFNWDVFGDRKTQFRGGVGIFTGRTPYVWLSNQYVYTGIEFTSYSISGSAVPAFVADPYNQPKGFKAASNEIDVINKDFRFPQVLRFSGAVDRELFWGVIGTAEVTYSKNLNEILYQNINLRPTGRTQPDGRPVYGNPSGTYQWSPAYIVPQYNNVLYLTNTNLGYQYTAVLQLQKPFSNGLTADWSYTYGVSKDQNSGSSSQASSNWGYLAISTDINNPALTYSDYDVRHRFVAAASYRKQWAKRFTSTVSAIYNGRSGKPYSTIYSRDYNGDGRANDLIFVPKTASDIILTTNNWDALNAYILGDPALNKARGSIITRNASREPWNHTIDVKFLQDFSIPGLKGHRVEFSVDVLNFLNLLNSGWGVYKYMNNDDQILSYGGIDSATGKAKFAFYPRAERFSVNRLLSRWQIQLGARYIF